MCKNTGLTTNLLKIDNFSMLKDIEDDTMDFVFGFSVFSHLSLELANSYMSEFNRVLKKGGVVGLTTRTLSIVNHARKLSQNIDIPEHARGLTEVFRDHTAITNSYENGEFVYRDYPHETKSGPGYGEALIPPKFISKNYCPLFGGNFLFIKPFASVNQAMFFLSKG